MYRLVLAIILVTFALFGQAQEITNLIQEQPVDDFENIKVQKLGTTPQGTSFIIWVKENVKPHLHKHHTEVIYVVEGSAEMVIDGLARPIQKGDFIQIKPNTVHEVTRVTSTEPLKVLSVQAPEFFGDDRIFIDPQ